MAGVFLSSVVWHGVVAAALAEMELTERCLSGDGKHIAVQVNFFELYGGFQRRSTKILYRFVRRKAPCRGRLAVAFRPEVDASLMGYGVSVLSL